MNEISFFFPCDIFFRFRKGWSGYVLVELRSSVLIDAEWWWLTSFLGIKSSLLVFLWLDGIAIYETNPRSSHTLWSHLTSNHLSMKSTEFKMTNFTFTNFLFFCVLWVICTQSQMNGERSGKMRFPTFLSFFTIFFVCCLLGQVSSQVIPEGGRCCRRFASAGEKNERYCEGEEKSQWQKQQLTAQRRRRQWWRFAQLCRIVSHEINHEKIHSIRPSFSLLVAGGFQDSRFIAELLWNGGAEAILWLTVWLFLWNSGEKVIWNSFTFSWYMASVHEKTSHEAERMLNKLDTRFVFFGGVKVFVLLMFPLLLCSCSHQHIPHTLHHQQRANKLPYVVLCWLRHHDNIS